MKLLNLTICFLVMMLVQVGFAGTSVRGGGDLCEDRIKVIRDDLKTWIQGGGPEGLKLPNSISSKAYSEAMLNEMERALIRCVGSGDSGYPVNVDGVAKVCRFDQTSMASQITCDFDKFQRMSESDQYVLVHHEYAGLARLEIPNETDSNYEISNQISGYLEEHVIKKLVISPKKASKGTTDYLAEIEKMFAQGIAPTEQDVSGWHAGRCFTAQENRPHGGILLTLPITVDEGIGPAFPKRNILKFDIWFGSKIDQFDSLSTDTKASIKKTLLEKGWSLEESYTKDGSLVIPFYSSTKNITLIRKYESYLILKYINNDRGIDRGFSCYFFKKVN